MCEEHAIRLTCFEVQPQLESEWCWGGFQAGLEREDHFDDQYRDLLYAHTPILQEPPDDLDETSRHGILSECISHPPDPNSRRRMSMAMQRPISQVGPEIGIFCSFRNRESFRRFLVLKPMINWRVGRTNAT
jgi:hypothetical protein